MSTSSKRIFTEGLVAGAIGYFTSALFFAILNVLAGKSVFYTPALLGSIFFYQLRDASALTVTAGPVIAFNGAYLMVYMIIGVLLAALAVEADEGPHLLYLSVLVGILGVILLVGGGIVFSQVISLAIPMWSILTAGLLAGAAMVSFLYRAHPLFRSELKSDVELELERN